jgi:hypothetical protein
MPRKPRAYVKLRHHLLPMKRQEEFDNYFDQEIPAEIAESSKITLLSVALLHKLHLRDKNPIPGCKTAVNMVKAVTTTMIRQFLTQIPFPLLETIVKGDLDEETISEYAQNSDLSFPCIYLGRFSNGQLTCHEIASIALILVDPDKTKKTLYNGGMSAVNHPNPVSKNVSAAAVEMARNWLRSFDQMGLDIDELDEDERDIPCPFQTLYAGYSDNHIRRFDAHQSCTSPVSI